MTNKIVYKKERRFKINIELMTILKLIILLGLLFLAFWIIYDKYIVIYIIEPINKDVGYLFTILVSLMILFFLVGCGITIGTTSRNIKIFIVIVIVYLIYLGYTNIGFGIRFRKNFHLLIFDTYESNSYKGILFFILNFLDFWIFVYIISFFFETEKE